MPGDADGHRRGLESFVFIIIELCRALQCCGACMRCASTASEWNRVEQRALGAVSKGSGDRTMRAERHVEFVSMRERCEKECLGTPGAERGVEHILIQMGGGGVAARSARDSSCGRTCCTTAVVTNYTTVFVTASCADDAVCTRAAMAGVATADVTDRRVRVPKRCTGPASAMARKRGRRQRARAIPGRCPGGIEAARTPGERGGRGRARHWVVFDGTGRGYGDSARGTSRTEHRACIMEDGPWGGDNPRQ